MKRRVAAAIAGCVLCLSGTALADCDGTRGDSAVIAVPKGKAVRVMYLRPGPYNNYVEVCTRDAPQKPWEMQTGEFANASGWYLLWEQLAQAADYQLNLWGGYVTDADPLPWPAARRTEMPAGAALAYYGLPATTAAMPNTIVEVCLHADVRECPVH